MGAYHFMNTSKPKEEYKPVFSKITWKPMINNNRKPFMWGSASVMQNIKL
jgi:hypothetical protein